MKKSYSFHNGMNILNVPESSFNYIIIDVMGEANTFYVDKMELRETKPVFDGKRVLGISAISFLLYSLVLALILFYWCRMDISFKLYSWIESLQELYI